MKKTLLCVLICLMGCFLYTACGPVEIPDPEGIMEPSQALYAGLDSLTPQETDVRTDKLGQESFRIVVDDGFGMKGFVSLNCQSYRAAIGAVNSISINHTRTCLRASDILNRTAGSNTSSETFFQSALQGDFFQQKSNEISSVISALAQQYSKNPGQVIVLVSDLMLSTEDDWTKAASAIQTYIIKPEYTTMGVIGIQGDFRGTIENLPVSPTTGKKRKVGDYMVLERKPDGNFRHPLYLMFFGDDQAVLNAMEKAMASLKGSNMLDQTTPYYATYFSEYDVVSRKTDDIKTVFDLGVSQYKAADYSAENIVRGVKNKAGEIRYPAATEMPESYQQLLNDIPIMKIYHEKRGNTEKNVTLTYTIPYAITDSSRNGAKIADPFGLVVPVKDLALTKDDYSVTAQILILNNQTDGLDEAALSWIEPDATLVSCESVTLDDACETVEVVLSVDTELLKLDRPLLCQVILHTSIDPQDASIRALFDASWADDFTLNLKTFDSESIQYNENDTSARYTAATTARTPFFSNLMQQGIGESQIQLVGDSIREKTSAFEQTAMFGIVVRNDVDSYVPNGKWESDEDFHGWAFSGKEADEILGIVR